MTVMMRWSCSAVPNVGALLYLQAVGMDDLIADGALHQHKVKLVLLILQCVLLPGFFAHYTHCCVGQHGLHGAKKEKRSRNKVY